MTSVSSTLDDLSSTVTGLMNSMGAIQTSINGLLIPKDYSSDLDDFASGLASANAAIASLTADLANVDNSSELAQISNTLADVQEDVRELLESGAVVNQKISIRNTAQLLLAKSLIETETTNPNVIVNGSLTVEFTDSNFTAAEIARVNAVTVKIATVLNSVSLTNTSSPNNCY